MKPLKFFEELDARESGRNPVFTAIEQLTESADIRLFLQGYIAWLMTEGKSLDEAERLCYENVGYILGYYGSETISRWFAVSEKISHPVFGRNMVTPEQAYEAGLQLGQQLADAHQ